MILELSCVACAEPHDPDRLQGVCSRCGHSLSARYDAARLVDRLRRGDLTGATMWRYRDVLPVDERSEPVSLGEGKTPLVDVPALGRRLGVRRLLVKDEGCQATASFKARGLSAAVTAARDRGARLLVAPSAGNAAGALAAYARRAGLACRVYVPEDCPEPNRLEARLAGAEVVCVPGTIADAAKQLRADAPAGAFDLSTLREPYRVDGKKTMGYELYEQLEGRLPDVILYPTGGGTGLLGMAKAFDEIERALGEPLARPRFVAVQSAGVAPVVHAMERNVASCSPEPDGRTLAAGLQVPAPFADAWLLRELRRSRGFAIAVEDEEILAGLKLAAECEGMLFSPEGSALVAALPRLRREERIGADETVVLFQTASAFKTPDVLRRAAGKRSREGGGP